MFLGYYNLANFITLAGLASSLTAVFAAAAYDFKTAVLMLSLAGLCDVCDGLIARNNIAKYEDKTAVFGCSLDVLCSFVGFVVAPVVITYCFGNRTAADIFIYIIFASCGAFSLANHNTVFVMRQGRTAGFRGVPVTVTAVFLPIIFTLSMFAPPTVTGYLLRILLVCLSVAFLINIRIKRPSLKLLVIVCTVCLFCLAMMMVLREVPVKYFVY